MIISLGSTVSPYASRAITSGGPCRIPGVSDVDECAVVGLQGNSHVLLQDAIRACKQPVAPSGSTSPRSRGPSKSRQWRDSNAACRVSNGTSDLSYSSFGPLRFEHVPDYTDYRVDAAAEAPPVPNERISLRTSDVGPVGADLCERDHLEPADRLPAEWHSESVSGRRR